MIVASTSASPVLCLRAEDVAQRLGISRSKAYLMMQSGELPVVRIGTLVRVPTRLLEEWVIEQAKREQVDPS